MVTSKDLGHTQYHIKGFFTEKAKGPLMPKGPGENTALGSLGGRGSRTHTVTSTQHSNVDGYMLMLLQTDLKDSGQKCRKMLLHGGKSTHLDPPPTLRKVSVFVNLVPAILINVSI